MKTVCFVNTHYFPFLGGIIQYTDNLIKELKKKNIHVIMVTLNVADLPEYEEIDGVEVYRLPCINLMGGRFPIIHLNRKCRGMICDILQQNIALMIINARFYILSLYMARISKKNKIRCMVIDHGSSHLTMGSSLMTKLGEWYEHISTELLKYYCKNFYGVSQASCHWLAHFGIQAKGILYNAVNLEYIHDVLKHPTEDYIKKYNLPENAFIVTFTGRLVIEKGILPLIDAVKNIRENFPNIYLIIAGDGPLRKQIEQTLSDGIILLGQVELDKIISLLKQSKILCLPSKSEGFPTSVLEAVACKCFVAATKVGGAVEIIPSKEFGILLEENDVKNIMSAIEYAYLHENEIKFATEASYVRMLHNFVWEKTGNQVYDILMHEGN